MKASQIDLGPEGLGCTEDGKGRGEGHSRGLHGGMVVSI